MKKAIFLTLIIMSLVPAILWAGPQQEKEGETQYAFEGGFSGILYTGERFVLYGSEKDQNGVIFTSPDGKTFTRVESIEKLQFTAATFGEGMILAAGSRIGPEGEAENEGSVLYYSTDGGNIWTEGTTIGSPANEEPFHAHFMEFYNNMFTAVSLDGRIRVSHDGDDWQAVNPLGKKADEYFQTQGTRVIKDKMFVWGHGADEDLIIGDGTDWQTAQFSGDTGIFIGDVINVGYEKGRYKVFLEHDGSYGEMAPEPAQAASRDGIVWEEQEWDYVYRPLDYVIQDDLIIGIRESWVITGKSFDELKEERILTESEDLIGLAANDSITVIAGDKGRVIYSLDGKTWEYAALMK